MCTKPGVFVLNFNIPAIRQANSAGAASLQLCLPVWPGILHKNSLK